MLNEVHLLAIPVMCCCCLGLQKRDELSYPLRVDGNHAGLQYLKRAEDIFVKWKDLAQLALPMRPFLPAYKL